MITETSVTHPTFIKKLLTACRKSMSQSVCHMRDRDGDAYLAVRYVTGKDGSKGFHITDRKGNNFARTIAAGICLRYNNCSYEGLLHVSHFVVFHAFYDHNL